MLKNNLNRWEPSKLKIYEVSLSAYADFTRRCVSYIIGLNCALKYISVILINSTEVIMTLYYEYKVNSSEL